MRYSSACKLFTELYGPMPVTKLMSGRAVVAECGAQSARFSFSSRDNEIHCDSPRTARTRGRDVIRGDGVDRLAVSP